VSLADDLRRLAYLARERGARLVLVGIPLNADGSAGSQARLIRRFARALDDVLSETGITVETWDETNTSVEATAELGLSGRPLDDRERAAVDSRAAAIVLRRYLDAVARPPTALPRELSGQE
jgi:putative Holliday junction resolvase